MYRSMKSAGYRTEGNVRDQEVAEIYRGRAVGGAGVSSLMEDRLRFCR